ncbi:MAG: hypothetical protein M2R45_05090 [Verrucomicrobia subdivision 3 bacterium]|nr:hypothetical protein [Limisphaerales bacterium]MCS1417167.1 hypothetical protein [Limisphaerales bacterium]
MDAPGIREYRRHNLQTFNMVSVCSRELVVVIGKIVVVPCLACVDSP